jgi:hypothetical protein
MGKTLKSHSIKMTMSADSIVDVKRVNTFVFTPI